LENRFRNTSPRPFREIPGLWRKIFRMDEAFFTAEAPRASGWNTLWAVIVYAVIVLYGFIPVVLNWAHNSNNYYYPDRTPVSAYLTPVILIVPCLLIAFYLAVGSMAGGAVFEDGFVWGSFKTLAYLVSLFYVPIGILIALILCPVLLLFLYIPHPPEFVRMFILYMPYVWLLVPLGCSFFGLVLSVRAMKVDYEFNTGQALRAILTPLVVFIIIPLTIVILALLGPATSMDFSNVVQNI
jgi:hypothetical protein